MPRVIQLIEKIATIAFISCFMFGSTLIVLTHFVVKRDFGMFKWLITVFVTSGIMFSAFENVITPMLHSYHSGFTFFTTKRIFNSPIWVMELMLGTLIVTYAGFFSVTISFLAVQFIYRYLAIFSPHKLMYFKEWKIALWICYPLMFGTLWAVSAYYLILSDSITDDYFKDAILIFYGENLTNVANLAVIAFNGNEFYWKSFYYTLIIWLIISSQYSIMIFCGYYMNREIKSKTSCVSSTLRRLHRQFFEALMLQIITPSVILFFPITFILLVPYFQSEINFPTGIFVSIFAIYPAVDALVLMYSVSDYSRVIKAMSRRLVSMLREEI